MSKKPRFSLWERGFFVRRSLSSSITSPRFCIHTLFTDTDCPLPGPNKPKIEAIRTMILGPTVTGAAKAATENAGQGAVPAGATPLTQQ